MSIMHGMSERCHYHSCNLLHNSEYEYKVHTGCMFFYATVCNHIYNNIAITVQR